MHQINLWTMPETYAAILALILLGSCLYFLGWERGNKAPRVFNDEDYVSGAEEAPVEQLVADIEMHAVLEPVTTGPIDLLLSPVVHRAEVDTLQIKLERERVRAEKAEQTKARHWETIKSLREKLQSA